MHRLVPNHISVLKICSTVTIRTVVNTGGWMLMFPLQTAAEETAGGTILDGRDMEGRAICI